MLQVQLTFTSATTLKSERGLKLNVEIYAALANFFSPVDQNTERQLYLFFKTQKSDLTLAQVQVTGDEFGSTWTSTV